MLLWTAFCAIFFATAHSDSHWDSFVRQPNRDEFTHVKRTLLQASARCSPNAAPTQEHRTRLFALIQAGNEWAFRASLLVTTCWDGGELEDFHRSAGSFFEVRPVVFSDVVEEESIPDEELRRMLTMLPLELVDDLDGKIAAIEHRIRLANGLPKCRSTVIAERMLSILEQRRQGLQRVRAETEKAKP